MVECFDDSKHMTIDKDRNKKELDRILKSIQNEEDLKNCDILNLGNCVSDVIDNYGVDAQTLIACCDLMHYVIHRVGIMSWDMVLPLLNNIRHHCYLGQMEPLSAALMFLLTMTNIPPCASFENFYSDYLSCGGPAAMYDIEENTGTSSEIEELAKRFRLHMGRC